MADRLTGKVAIVTGAGSGNGRAIAIAFGREGAFVACADMNESAARAVADEIGAGGGKAIGVGMDVARLADCERAVVATVEAAGGLDVLVNNAGIWVSGTVLSTTEEAWDRQQAVNVKGVFLMTKAALPQIIRRGGGSIIMLASQAGLRATPGAIPYVTSKHAVVGMTRCLALDHAADNVRVNAICPGLIETPMAAQIYRERAGDSRDIEAVREERRREFPLGRVGAPEDVAAIAVHFASDESAWVTGTCYSLDGGAGLRMRV